MHIKNSFRYVSGGGGFDFGNALMFNGTGYVLIGGTTLTLSSNYTFSAWFKRDNLTHEILGYGASNQYIGVSSSTSISVRTNGFSAQSFTVPTMVIDTWYHVVVSCVNDNIRVYLNGVESSTGAIANNGSIAILRVGWYPSAAFIFEGVIDDVGILNGVGATQTNVSDIYNGGNGEDFIGVIGSASVYYHFNESGTDTIAADESGNGKIGTLSGLSSTPWEPH